MTTPPEAPAPAPGRCPVAHGFDAMGDAYYTDPAKHLAEVRGEHPVFFYPYLNAWIVTRRADVEAVLSDWQAFSSAANSALIDVPEQHRAVIPPDLMSQMLVGSDPPSHTRHRAVAQRGFTRSRMEALAPGIEARAHRIVDRFEANGSGNLMEDYCLELTTQTIMAHMGLGAEDDPMMRQLRDDLFQVLASAQEPLPEPRRGEVWERFTRAALYLREIIDERRENPGTDLISDMASVRDKDGAPVLTSAQIALHLAEFAAAGTDTTAQAMANAVLFLADNPQALADAQADPDLWSSVFEETVRRRPSSSFASRQAVRDTVIGGVEIKADDMVWLALASANTDPEHTEAPFAFDIHRHDAGGHLAFTQGRHTCLGQDLARVQGAIGLKVLFERLPSLRPVQDAPLDFVRMALLPVRRSLPVTWDPEDTGRRTLARTTHRLTLRVAERREESQGVTSFVLEHPDGGTLPAWKPGAHIEVDLPGGMSRQYSLCSDPAEAHRWHIGVLREPAGRGGSAHLHDTVQAGAVLKVSRPRNHFPLRTAERYLFVAGGIGITPILAMIRQAEADGADWTLLYGGRTRASMAFLTELAPYGGRVLVRPQDEFGLLDLAGHFGEPADGTLIYACGPEPLLRAAGAASAHWPQGSLHVERFAPKTAETAGQEQEFEVEFAASGLTAKVPAGRSILQVAEELGLPALSSCAEGTCGTCETPLMSGEAEHRDAVLTEAEQQAQDTIMICVSRAAGTCPRLVLDL
ncbi:cytochrome P450 [Streptomyces nitrosporeus]|uniref:cytochrome P450 n=1 Tax=Streptomyces nitrosporeus TaxID=28894 RepID=UPI00331DB27A